jgi:hypothetical protein
MFAVVVYFAEQQSNVSREGRTQTQLVGSLAPTMTRQQQSGKRHFKYPVGQARHPFSTKRGMTTTATTKWKTTI